MSATVHTAARWIIRRSLMILRLKMNAGGSLLKTLDRSLETLGLES